MTSGESPRHGDGDGALVWEASDACTYVANDGFFKSRHNDCRVSAKTLEMV